MPACLEASNRRTRFGTSLCSVTLSPTIGQAGLFGLMKSTWGSMTTSAVRRRSRRIPGSGRNGFFGSAYADVIPLAVSGGCAAETTVAAAAPASPVRNERRPNMSRSWSWFIASLQVVLTDLRGLHLQDVVRTVFVTCDGIDIRHWNANPPADEGGDRLVMISAIARTTRS